MANIPGASRTGALSASTPAERSGAADRLRELAENIERSTRAARQTQDIAAQAREATGRGVDAVTLAMAHMDSIEEATRKVREIVALIDAIASQTNLLALNAAIEAARAGEHGRGFGVVAAEVRSLSKRCADSAADIRAVVDGVAGRVKDSAQAVDGVVEAIAEINGSVGDMGRLMDEIVAADAQQSRILERLLAGLEPAAPRLSGTRREGS